MTDPAADKDKFVPAFAMPVIAPPPASFSGTPAAHYAAVKVQSDLDIEDVVVSAEVTGPSDPNQPKKGLRIKIPNPTALVTDSLPFGTLFALMGGMLSYKRAAPDGSAVNLKPILPAPFRDLLPARTYPAPVGLDLSKPWGAFRLTVWGMDFEKLTKMIGVLSACRTIYYLGVDETSAKAALEPLVKLEYPEASYDKSVAESETPAFRLILEKFKGAAYTTPPSYAVLVQHFVAGLMNGTAELLVKGGAAIGQAIQVPDSASTSSTPPPVGRVELWFLDGAQLPAFISSAQFFRGAQGYDF